MFWNILKFEINYRRKRPATYIYFGIFFLLAFLAVTTDVVKIGGSSGQLKENAPTSITFMMLVLSSFFVMITSAIMGVPVLRDFEQQTESIMFINPIKKRDYLFGRFFGSFIVLIFVFSGSFLGFVLGEFMPWREADKLMPFSLWNYLQPFLFYVVPNLFFSGALFFAAGTLSRKMITVYAQGIVILMIYMVAANLISTIDNRIIAGLIDPFGINTVSIYTRYWTMAEKNTQVVPLAGIVLANRSLWFSVGIIALIITYYRFSFSVIQNSVLKKKRKIIETISIINTDVVIPLATQKFTIANDIKRVVKLAWFYFKNVVKEPAFIVIVFTGIVLLCVNADSFGTMYGTQTFPVTYEMLQLIQTFTLFFLIIVVFFSGELIWKERNLKTDQIFDALPVNNAVTLAGKFFSLVFIYIVLIFVLIFISVIIQTIKGYHNYELGLYFKTLFSETFLMIILYTLLAFFIQVLVNHKFLGYALMIVFFIASAVISNLGVEHRLFHFSSGSMGTYSDMNGYGHYIRPFIWFSIYWVAFACVLFAVAILFSVRGMDTVFRKRWKLAKIRFVRPVMIFMFSCLAVFILSGSYIFYNTNVLNKFENSKNEEKKQAEYEKQLKKYQFTLQPKITDTRLKVDIFPEERYFVAEGYYILKNKNQKPLTEIHIQLNSDFQSYCDYLTFSRPAKLKEKFDKFYYNIYQLEQPLQSGDTLKMNFKIRFVTKGFVNSGSNTNIVYNGTFFNNLSYLPTLGYSADAELSADDKRKENGLKEKERMMDRNNPVGLSQCLLGDDADRINFEIILSTSKDQIAVAPGYLQKEWTENDRRFFHYKMDATILNFYSVLSAHYKVLRDKWNDINLEIYYQKGHEYNIHSMITAMKKSFEYYTKNFCPYPYRQLRILEFPRYESFAQSFANTIPFSEGIGFIMDVGNEDVDMGFYVTCHEIAHQWWAHQVTDANVKGNGMISEALSQYSALMVMKHTYSQELMQKFLKHEMDSYLFGRSMERKKEMPLEMCENQGYIHYNKGSVVFFALQDYISEDSVNLALKRFAKDWAFREDRYPNSADLLRYLEAVTPDSLKNIITDMFKTITLFENKTEKVKSEKQAASKYNVTIDVSAKKYRADSLGNEKPLLVINDWIDIGVYGKDVKGKDKLLYLKKHKINKSQMTFTVTVAEKPLKAGIDPLNKLVDRTPDDNVKSVD
ncbi:MAG: aminopeptidase [Bacteroidia bacterium]|nr:aminopeptidase [Bacteroidia bacterium]